MDMDGGCRRGDQMEFKCPPGWEIHNSYIRTCLACVKKFKPTTEGTCLACACSRGRYFNFCGPIEMDECKSCRTSCSNNHVRFDRLDTWTHCQNEIASYDYDKCRAYNIFFEYCGIPLGDDSGGTYDNLCQLAGDYYDNKFSADACSAGSAFMVARSPFFWRERCINCLEFAS
eukprot:1754666-Rhodomonas_salina.1